MADDLRVIQDVRKRIGRVGRKLAAIATPAQPRTGKFTLTAWVLSFAPRQGCQSPAESDPFATNAARDQLVVHEPYH
jgi:hypothetical protein